MKFCFIFGLVSLYFIFLVCYFYQMAQQRQVPIFYRGNYDEPVQGQRPARRAQPQFVENANYERQRYSIRNRGEGEGAPVYEDESRPRAAASNYVSNWEVPVRGGQVNNDFMNMVDNYRIKYKPDIVSNSGLA
jgi:hypothetical protein